MTAHFVGDFILQSDWMAVNKSKRWNALALHVAVYAACFWWCGLLFMGLTFVAHFMQDAVTSRINSRLWPFRFVLAGKRWRVIAEGIGQEQEAFYVDDLGTRHWFFVGIGADQLLHFYQLVGLYQWLQ